MPGKEFPATAAVEPLLSS